MIMPRILITGAADGLGMMAAKLLVAADHEVVLHARNIDRGKTAMEAVPGASTVITGDLSSLRETASVASQANDIGYFDAVIHNAGVGYREATRSNTAEGLPQLFVVNSLAPYLLTALIKRPGRLVYLSSGLHRQGDPSLQDLTWKDKRWNGFNAYADSKLHDLILAFAVARRWKDVLSNALEPGWVATRMGGAGATDSLEEGPRTQAWLAVSEEPAAKVSGKYFFHQRQHSFLPAAADTDLQDRFLTICAELTGVILPS